MYGLLNNQDHNLTILKVCSVAKAVDLISFTYLAEALRDELLALQLHLMLGATSLQTLTCGEKTLLQPSAILFLQSTYIKLEDSRHSGL